MPNHVTNVLTLHGESDQIRAMLEAIQYDDLGIGSVDFNKIIPMPESLNIEAGSQTSTGLKAYQDFIEVYTLGGTIHQDDLENIPRKSEDAFLRQRSDIRPKEWKLGKAAWNNIRLSVHTERSLAFSRHSATPILKLQGIFGYSGFLYLLAVPLDLLSGIFTFRHFIKNKLRAYKL